MSEIKNIIKGSGTAYMFHALKPISWGKIHVIFARFQFKKYFKIV